MLKRNRSITDVTREKITSNLKKLPSFLNRRKKQNAIDEDSDEIAVSFYGHIQSYEKYNKLGEGTYANVYRGYSKITKTPIAIKEIKLESNEGIPSSAIREISILKILCHPNIVAIHDVVSDVNKLAVILEFAPLTLHFLIKGGHIKDEQNVAILAYQLLTGLVYCKKKSIVHRDLKPRNILIDNKGVLKIADFGLSRSMSIPIHNLSSNVVTLWYRPPEVLYGCQDYDYAVDVWSVGCIIFEMIEKRPLFQGQDVKSQLYAISRTIGPFPENLYSNKRHDPLQEPITENDNFNEACAEKHHLLYNLGKRFRSLVIELINLDPVLRISPEDALKNSAFESALLLLHDSSESNKIFSEQVEKSVLLAEFLTSEITDHFDHKK